NSRASCVQPVIDAGFDVQDDDFARELAGHLIGGHDDRGIQRDRRRIGHGVYFTFRGPLCEHFAHDISGNVGQTEIASLEFVGELFVIDAQEIQHRRVQIVYVHDILDGVVTEVVGGAGGMSGAHSAAAG